MADTYLARAADTVLQTLTAEHPAVLVVGPRATGKTTTCRKQSAERLNLADPRQAQAVAADPPAALRGRARPLLIDEWQIVPEALLAVKEAVDHDHQPGQFLVTGSVRGDFDATTWPGTGRLVRLPMYGLTEREIEGRLDRPSWIEQVLNGHLPRSNDRLDTRDYVERAMRSGFPEPALRLSQAGRQRWLVSYVEQLVTRDAREVSEGRDPVRLRRYLEAMALNTAGIVDDVTLYEAARISKGTARAYDALLHNLLVVDSVPAWTSNRLKRLALAPKRYLVDPALMVGILGIDTDDVLRDGGLLGRVLDTFAMAQLRADCALAALPPRIHHLRTAQGRQEVDILLEIGARKIIAIEVKASSTPRSSDAKHLRWLRHELGESLIAAVVLHTGPETFMLEEGIVAAPISTLWS